MREINRKTKALLAVHDYGTREGANASKVYNQMKAAGFSDQEIRTAVSQMAGITETEQEK